MKSSVEEDTEETEHRPMSPVDETVVKAPRTLDDVLHILLPRIQPQKGIPGLTVEDQQTFVDILVGEVSGYWSDIKRQVDHPSLTQVQNRELHRRVAVDFLSMAIDLFNSYLTKPASLLERHVYDSVANATRLKAKLAVEAHKRLSVASIRRQVLASLQPNATNVKIVTRIGAAGGTSKEITSDESKRKQAVAREVKDLINCMPTITSKAEDILRQQAEILAEVRAEVEARRLYEQSAANYGMNERCQEVEEDTESGVKLGKSTSCPVIVRLKDKVDGDSVHTRNALHSRSVNNLNDVLRSCSGWVEVPQPQDETRSEELPPLLQTFGQSYTYRQGRKRREAERQANKEKQKSLLMQEEEHSDFREEDLPIQPSVVSTQLPPLYKTDDIVRTSDMRVSDRRPKASIILQPCGPIYNELLGDISAEQMKAMDKNLYLGEEIRDVYEEILQTVEDEHLLYDKDGVIECCADGVINLDEALSSATLRHRRSRRVINQDLRHATHPVWGSRDRHEWVMSNQYTGPLPPDLKKDCGLSPPFPPHVIRAERQYQFWRSWWRATIDTEDFLKFVARNESDYLHHIFHLYESEGDDSEDEEMAEKRRDADNKRQARAKQKQMKLEELRMKKQCHVEGMWNVNTIAMGGLGEDPEVEGTGSCQADSEDEDETEGEHLSHQERFETIWKSLQMPDSQRVDMAIKYSTIDKRSLLDHVLDLWEAASQAVLKREVIISELEAFERLASDPGRFFDKGFLGKSSCRLGEAKARGRIYRRLEPVEAAVLAAVSLLQKELGDTVTYQGRPYLEKMRLDKTEMLYWLQQERRRAVMAPRSLQPLATSKTNI